MTDRDKDKPWPKYSFLEQAAAEAREESRRYWAANDKRFPKQEPSFWPTTPEGIDDTLRERRRRRRQKGVWP